MSKTKANSKQQPELKLPEWYYNQSGVIPFRRRNGKIEILLVTSRKKKRWIIPKGIIETDLSGIESARKEAIEEAGVDGHIYAQPIGSYKNKKWGAACHITVYIMKVQTIHSEWYEDDFRERAWFDLQEVKKIIANKNLRRLIKAAAKNIKNKK